VQDYTINQHSAADAGAQSQHHHISLSTGRSPKNFANERNARIIFGTDGEIASADDFAQELSFEERQVARRALHASGAGIDDPFAAYANSPHRRLGALYNRMNEVLQAGDGSRRWRMNTIEQFSAQTYDSGLDSGSTNVNADGQGLKRIGAGKLFAHNGLCIIPSLCNSTG
jgi:hypothetical protein